uniref:L1 transposable element RRM domain-containing protein n=1 Tax=Cyprinus carpio carpio TaxID=630221 RepID=A0A9J7ZHS7_CYPCA
MNVALPPVKPHINFIETYFPVHLISNKLSHNVRDIKMSQMKGRQYTQTTLEVESHAATAEKSEGAKTSGAAGLTEESPISLGSLRSFLKTEIEGLGKEICDEISSLWETTKADMKTICDELTEKVERLFSMQAEAANIQMGMEQSLSDTSDRLMALENSCQSLAADHKKLQEKCIDLENRGRRQNIRILNIPEGSENNTPTAFVAKFLSKVLGEENFDGPILIDRAHRSLAPKPRKGERPQPIIARLHYYSDKEKIMSLSRSKGKLSFKGAQVHIFPDMSPEVGRQRAAFNQVKAKLRDAGIQYRMFFPAKLEITADGSKMSFTDPQAVERFFTAKNHHHWRSIKRKNINLDTCVW